MFQLKLESAVSLDASIFQAEYISLMPGGWCLLAFSSECKHAPMHPFQALGQVSNLFTKYKQGAGRLLIWLQ